MRQQTGVIIARGCRAGLHNRDTPVISHTQGLSVNMCPVRTIREELTSAQRSTPLKLTIDPGFVHHRRIETILGSPGMSLIDRLITSLPIIPEWQREVRINHIYARAMLGFCSQNGARSLGEVLATQQGKIFCSTEKLAPCPGVYETDRAVSLWVSGGSYDRQIEFHYSTSHICASTMWAELYHGGPVSIIAELHDANSKTIIFNPLVMGLPWLEKADQKPTFDIMWWSYDFYENFVEDFAEFKQVLAVPPPASPDPMKLVSEWAFKRCLGKILGDTVTRDWGGETSDYYTAHLHLNGRRVTAAFLLKGPAHFAPMNLNHLGKNNDQIVRLASEPAQVLIVQHSHDILPPVRETLRAFAVQPSRPRRYCLIDGRDSLRLLLAYDLYDWAVELSGQAQS
jgi:hypothetical protein